jgi:hypothetical protein
MLTRLIHVTALPIALLGGLAACEMTLGGKADKAPGFAPEYLGVETMLLDDDLVNFHVAMKGARTKADVADYAKCAAAEYTLIRGFGLYATCAQMLTRRMVFGGQMRFIPSRMHCPKAS